jgi:hypothetical protein
VFLKWVLPFSGLGSTGLRATTKESVRGLASVLIHSSASKRRGAKRRRLEDSLQTVKIRRAQAGLESELKSRPVR